MRLFGTDEQVNFYVESRGCNYTTAHNTPLQFAVHSGLFCGILYLLFNLLAGLKAVWFALSHPEKAYSLLPLIVAIAFGVCSMLESLKTPFTYMISMYYFFVQAPLMVTAAQKQPAGSPPAVKQ